ncbi:TetR/AcrR family transcriptional regulator [Paenibacillus sp. GCM10027626]|uniref:TetR/AcrR family transcriptional regulator n=1 Tax=Paenibacillus sp. GCM10027626 TaxID=3273411 RepID=UPI003629A698
MAERTRKSVDRRQQIVEAASQSFTMFGYKATTMELVSKIASVGKGTIYTFFTTKEELFDEIMDQLIGELRWIAQRSIDPERTFFANLTTALHELLQFSEKHELIVKLSQEVRDVGTPAARAGIERLEQTILSFLREQVVAAIEKRELRQVDPTMTAVIMLKIYVALSTEWPVHSDPPSKEAIASYVSALLQDGLRAK